MGGWKWGYPKGQRIAIAAYEAVDGRWKSLGYITEGLTASNIDHYRRFCPDAFSNPIGSLHNKPVEE